MRRELNKRVGTIGSAVEVGCLILRYWIGSSYLKFD